MKHAFSLVELSIVLVILGLLTGGILAGQNLIRASELRSVSTQYQNFQSATNSFRDTYLAVPGDMKNATSFWGDDATNCADAAVTNGTPGTCNGDGDGQFAAAGAANGTGERFQYWKQLTLAGMIEGTYTGLAGAGSTNDHDAGVNCPVGKLGQSAWGLAYSGNHTNDNNYFNGDYGNDLVLGAVTGSTGRENDPLLTPEEMWNIDKKMDDGLPAQGILMVRSRITCTADATSGAALTSAAADAAKLDAKYNLSSTSVSCTPLFKNYP